MMTFILQDIIVCIVASFIIGLYVGAFVQRRRDMKIIKPLQKIINHLLENEKIEKEEK